MFAVDRVPGILVPAIPETTQDREHCVAVRGEDVQRHGDHGPGHQGAVEAEQKRARPRAGQGGREAEGVTMGGEAGGSIESNHRPGAVLGGAAAVDDAAVVRGVRASPDDVPRTAQGAVADRGAGLVERRGAPAATVRRHA